LSLCDSQLRPDTAIADVEIGLKIHTRTEERKEERKKRKRKEKK
jgi:hypothetical protein